MQLNALAQIFDCLSIHRGTKRKEHLKSFNRMDRKYINNINSFVAKRSAVRKCGNAYYAMQKEKFRFTFTANDKRQI